MAAKKTPPSDPFEKLQRAGKAAGASAGGRATRSGAGSEPPPDVSPAAETREGGAPGLAASAFNLDLDSILRGGRRRMPTRSRTTTKGRATSRAGTGDMDGALRAAVRAEIAPVVRLLRELVDEVARLRRAEAETAAKVTRAGAAAVKAAKAKAAPRKTTRRP